MKKTTTTFQRIGELPQGDFFQFIVSPSGDYSGQPWEKPEISGRRTTIINDRPGTLQVLLPPELTGQQAVNALRMVINEIESCDQPDNPPANRQLKAWLEPDEA